MPLAFFGLLGMGYLLYLDAGAQIIGYLPYYIAPDEFYNLSLRPILMWLVGLVTGNPFPIVKWLSAAILVLVMVHCVRQSHKSPQQAVQWGVGLIALYLLLVSPSVFQWYLVWLLALVTLTQSWLIPAWLYWSWAVNLDYLETLPSVHRCLIPTAYRGVRAGVGVDYRLLVGGSLRNAGVRDGQRRRRRTVRDSARWLYAGSP